MPYLAEQGMQGDAESSWEHLLQRWPITQILRRALCQWRIAGCVVLGSHR